MAGRYLTGALLALMAVAGPVGARAAVDFDSGARLRVALPRPSPYLQCVPFAREHTGVNLFGDAHTWWNQAEGRYARGRQPRVGAVMAFRAHGGSRLGHVAAVTRLVDSRTVLISHSNWSPIDGRRGQIERNVRAVDVSPKNDWSRVRIWFAPIKGLGATAWPLAGFIYNQRPGKPDKAALIKVARTAAEKSELVRQFSGKPRPTQPQAETEAAPKRTVKGADPIGDIIARKGR